MEAIVRAFASSQQKAVENSNASAVSDRLAPDCKRFIAPATYARDMGMSSSEGADNATYEEHFAKMLPLLGDTTTTIHDICIDLAAKKATVHLTHGTKIVGSDDLFQLENMIFLHFNNTADKITKVVEYADPVECKRYMAQLMIAAGQEGAT